MLDIVETDKGYEVKFEYKPWLVDAIKKIPGSYYMGAKKAWGVPKRSETALLNWAQNFGTAKVTAAPAIEIGEIDPLPELTIDIPLLRKPFTYQNNGIAYALEKRKCIFGDQPGLGKTGQAIAASIGASAKCILVICPATLRENWKREWKIWTGKDVMVLSDKVKSTWPQYYKVGMCNVFISNYESLKKYFVESINKPDDKPLRLNHIKFKDTIRLFDTVIVDESHRCKDGRTQQAKFVMGISRGKQNIFALTGTPVVNKPIDLIPQLYIIEQLDVFGGYKGFVGRYCQGMSGASNLKELNYLMHKNCFFRREKKDVLKDLPDKMRNIVRCDISNRVEYNKAENDFIKYLKDNLGKSDAEVTKSLRGEIMVQMGILKKVAAKGKVEEVLEHIQEVVEAGEKIVVFAWHRDIIYELKKYLPGAVTVMGDDTADQRQHAVDSFQACRKCGVKYENHTGQNHDHVPSDVNVIILNIKSGGVGITLTAASRVCFIEQPWHPADYDQCEDRTHRISQKNAVQSTNFLGHQTIDEYIYSIIEKKRVIANEVTGATEEIETNMVDEFVNLFMKDKM